MAKSNKLLQRGRVNISNVYLDDFMLSNDNEFEEYYVRSRITVGKKSDGSYWIRGHNYYGGLGVGDTMDRPYWVRIPIDNIKKVIIGECDTGIITNDGKFYSAGSNEYGQGGFGDVGVQRNNFTLSENISDVVDGAISRYATYLIKSDGSIWVSGSNYNQSLGQGEGNSYASTDTTNGKFIQMVGGPFTDIVKVRAENDGLGILRSNGDLYYVGGNGSGQCGDGGTASKSQLTVIASNIKTFEVGDGVIFIVKNDGTFWGSGTRYNCNLGTYQSDTSVKTWENLSGRIEGVVKDIVSDENCSGLVTESGDVYCCGYNGSGEIGNGVTTVNQSWSKTSNIQNIVRLEGGYQYFIAKAANGDTYCWGRNDSGVMPFHDSQLECTTEYWSKHVTTPVKVKTVPIDDTNYSNLFNIENRLFATTDNGDYLEANKVNHRIICGPYSYHSVILKCNGRIYSTGKNDYGQLGRASSNAKETSYAQVTLKDPKNIRDVVVNRYNTYVLKKDGTVWACGGNQYGQLGLGASDNSKRTSFIQLPIDDVKLISAGMQHVFVLKNDGTVWACGDNQYGQLGTGDNTNKSVFTRINIDGVYNIFACYGTTFVTKYDGTIWATGYNKYGQMGLGEDVDKNVFTLLPIKNARYISANYGATLVTHLDGSVSAAGADSDGVLAIGTSTSDSSSNSTKKLFIKVNVPMRIVKAVVQEKFSHFLCANGRVFWAGYNADAINLNAQNGGNAYAPSRCWSGHNAIDISNGYINIALTDFDGTVSAGGSNAEGQCGGGTTNCYTYNYKPYSNWNGISSSEFLNKPKIVCGRTHMYYISKEGKLYGVGSNANSTSFGSAMDASITTFKESDIVNVKDVIPGGMNFTYILKYDGSVYGVGYNNLGQLGLNTTSSVTSFTQITTNTDNTKKIACGENHAVILKHNGEVYVTGDNTYGQLGLGNTTASKIFVKAPIENVKDIFCSAHATFVLKNNGELYVAGRNDIGELGLGDKVNKTSFTQIPVLGIKTVFTSNNCLNSSGDVNRYYFILKEDGTLFGCGENSCGQLGLNHTSNVESLTQIPIDDVKSIKMGHTTTYVLKNDGSLWGCGCNCVCELNLEDRVNHLQFVNLNLGSDVYDIQAGVTFAAAIKENGTLYTFGNNNAGQLAIGATTPTYATAQKVDYDMDILCGSIKSVENQKNCSLINGKKLLLTTTDVNVINNLGSIYTGEVPFSQAITLPYEAKQVMLSKTHFLLLCYNGDVYGCGSNLYGQLLKDTSVTTISELTKLDISGISSIGGGDGYSIFVDSMGNVNVIGLNDSYQLGLLDTDNRTTLTRNSYISNVKKIVCRDNSIYALTHDNDLYVQGYNPANGRLGLGSSVRETTVTSFTKALSGVLDIEVLADHAKATLLNKNIAIAGKSHLTFKNTNADYAVFNKIKLDNSISNKVTAMSIDFESDVYVLTRTISNLSEIEVENKSLTAMTLRLSGEEDPIIKVVMKINNEVINRLESIVSSQIRFEIPQNKIREGKNVIEFIAYTESGEEINSEVEIIKQAVSNAYAPGTKILIKNNVYQVNSAVLNADGNYILSLDKALTTDLVKGDAVYKLLNDINVYIKTNNQGAYKQADFVGIELLSNGTYKETYNFKEKDIQAASMKLEVVDGNLNTALKKPTMLFKTNEDVK